MPLEDIQKGMKVTGYTVFEGHTIEPFSGTVKGFVRNMLGPQRDVIIVEFEDERLKHTGIMHGMSGSPVYIGNKLIGAVSLALSPFPLDPIAGVTPIAYMLDEGLDGAAPPPSLASLFTRRSLIGPLTLAGIEPQVFERFRRRFDNFPGGVRLLPPAHSAAAASAPRPDRRVDPQGSDRLEPGSAVALTLLDGDSSLTATGTVTWRDGNKIYAFGHPFLTLGEVSFPMAGAEVVASIADQTYPFKLANAGPPIGAVVRDRITAIVGEVGAVPKMIPVRMAFHYPDGDGRTFSYRMIEDINLTPMLLELALSNSVQRQWRHLTKGTYRVQARIELQDGRSIGFDDFYVAGDGDVPGSLQDAVADLGTRFTALYVNRFRPVSVARVEMDVHIDPRVLYYTIEDVIPRTGEVRAGGIVPLTLVLRRHRGGIVRRAIDVPIPRGVGGETLTLRVLDARSADGSADDGGRPDPDRAANFDELVRSLDGGRSSGRLYIQLSRQEPGLMVDDHALAGLPPSIRHVLEGDSKTQARLNSLLVWEESIPLDGFVEGRRELSVAVRTPP